MFDCEACPRAGFCRWACQSLAAAPSVGCLGPPPPPGEVRPWPSVELWASTDSPAPSGSYLRHLYLTKPDHLTTIHSQFNSWHFRIVSTQQSFKSNSSVFFFIYHIFSTLYLKYIALFYWCQATCLSYMVGMYIMSHSIHNDPFDDWQRAHFLQYIFGSDYLTIIWLFLTLFHS